MGKLTFGQNVSCSYSKCGKMIDAGRSIKIGGCLVHPECESDYRDEIKESESDGLITGEPVWVEYRWPKKRMVGDEEKFDWLIEGTGRVKFYGAHGNKDQVYGFIIPNGGGKPVYFENFPWEIKSGDRVRYGGVQKSRREKSITALWVDILN